MQPLVNMYISSTTTLHLIWNLSKKHCYITKSNDKNNYNNAQPVPHNISNKMSA